MECLKQTIIFTNVGSLIHTNSGLSNPTAESFQISTIHSDQLQVFFSIPNSTAILKLQAFT
jgi:hypothetical protein